MQAIATAWELHEHVDREAKLGDRARSDPAGEELAARASRVARAAHGGPRGRREGRPRGLGQKAGRESSTRTRSPRVHVTWRAAIGAWRLALQDSCRRGSPARGSEAGFRLLSHTVVKGGQVGVRRRVNVSARAALAAAYEGLGARGGVWSAAVRELDRQEVPDRQSAAYWVPSRAKCRSAGYGDRRPAWDAQSGCMFVGARAGKPLPWGEDAAPENAFEWRFAVGDDGGRKPVEGKDVAEDAHGAFGGGKGVLHVKQSFKKLQVARLGGREQ